MANAHKLPKPRNRYYVENPDVMLSLGEVERLVEHLIKMGMLDKYPENEQKGILARHTLILSETRQKVKDAKEYYKIK